MGFRLQQERLLLLALLAADAADAVAAFRAWHGRHRTPVTRPGELAEGVALAVERRRVMAGWMAREPARALENALSRSDYQALPKELQPYFEKPFNAEGNLLVLPVCDAQANREPARILEIAGTSWQAAQARGALT